MDCIPKIQNFLFYTRILQYLRVYKRRFFHGLTLALIIWQTLRKIKILNITQKRRYKATSRKTTQHPKKKYTFKRINYPF